MGKILSSQASASSDRPFKEHQLKQLRAQCLVHLAFRHANTTNIFPYIMNFSDLNAVMQLEIVGTTE